MGVIPLVIVGCGQILTHHCRALAALPPNTFQVVALCDPSEERRTVIAEQLRQSSSSHLLGHGVAELTQFNTLDDFLASSIPARSAANLAVFISVPHDLHVSIATKGLDAGLNVIMEKPLAPTLEECHALLAHAAKPTTKGMLIISEQSPYWEEVRLAKSLLQEGKIGNLITAASYYYESMRDNVTSGLDAAGGLGWRTSLKRAGGGIVIDGGLHWIRPLRELCGEVEEVVGVTANVERGLGMEGETLAHALLKMRTRKGEGGASAGKSTELVATFSANMMHTAVMAHDTCPYFRVTGTKGEMVIYGTGLNPNGGGGLKLYNEENPNGVDMFAKDRQGGFFLGFRGIWDVVSEILSKDDRVRAMDTVRNAAADVGVALTLYQSSASGKWERCSQFLS